MERQYAPPALPGYEFLKRLPGGGMGMVFQARRLAGGKLVVVKMIQSAELDRVERLRFIVQGDLLARLDHPYIVRIDEFGEHDGRPYLVMPFVEGGDLHQRRAEFVLQTGAAPEVVEGWRRKVSALLEKVARAVHHVHQRAVLHRDLKPSNILLDARGEPQVCDLGLARRLDESIRVSASREVVGTWKYMAPEQMAGRRDLTFAADVWALGAILYELATGRPPFVGDDDGLDESRKLQAEEPEELAALNPALDGDADLHYICSRCLRRDPEQRYRSAEELALDLKLYGNGRRVRPVPTVRERLGRLGRLMAGPPREPSYFTRWQRSLGLEAATSLLCHAGLFVLLRPAGRGRSRGSGISRATRSPPGPTGCTSGAANA